MPAGADGYNGRTPSELREEALQVRSNHSDPSISESPTLQATGVDKIYRWGKS